ncbi:MAG: phosphatidate cytidylyltransferase [Candidatus Gastranaerophilales bacterium]|nr:phosphatidate cytidylyltransferase [Candidatus Gastranaerophilales bacterium]
MKRVVTGLIFFSLTLASILLGGFWLALFLAIICFIGEKEYVHLNETKGNRPSFTFIAFFGFLVFGAALFNRYDLMIAIVSCATIVSFLAIMTRERSTIADTATSLLGVLYGMLLPAHLVLLRGIDKSGLHFLNYTFNPKGLFQLNEGLGYLILVFAIIVMTDCGAYYIGSKFGKTPLAPRISPKKTLEGSIGGFISAVFISLIVGSAIHIDPLNCIVAGILFSAFAQLGDLAESMMKRDANAKDASDFLPGHGGILDRADSFIFTAAVAYYYFNYAYDFIRLLSERIF